MIESDFVDKIVGGKSLTCWRRGLSWSGEPKRLRLWSSAIWPSWTFEFDHIVDYDRLEFDLLLRLCSFGIWSYWRLCLSRINHGSDHCIIEFDPDVKVWYWPIFWWRRWLLMIAMKMKTKIRMKMTNSKMKDELRSFGWKKPGHLDAPEKWKKPPPV